MEDCFGEYVASLNKALLLYYHYIIINTFDPSTGHEQSSYQVWSS
jgi:hypothetical protein